MATPFDLIMPPGRAPYYNDHRAERERYAREIRENGGGYNQAEHAAEMADIRAPIDDAFSRAAANAARLNPQIAQGMAAGAAGRKAGMMDDAASGVARDLRRTSRQRILDSYGVDTGSWDAANKAAGDAARAANSQDDAMWQAVLALGQESIRSDKDLERELAREERRNQAVRDNRPTYFPEWSLSNPYGTSSI